MELLHLRQSLSRRPADHGDVSRNRDLYGILSVACGNGVRSSLATLKAGFVDSGDLDSAIEVRERLVAEKEEYPVGCLFVRLTCV